MNSVISEMPGPEVAVNARAPFQLAPITIPMAANSSSAWIMAYFLAPVPASIRKRLQYLSKLSTTDVEGVMFVGKAFNPTNVHEHPMHKMHVRPIHNGMVRQTGSSSVE